MEEWCLEMPSPMETKKVSKVMENDEPNTGIRQTGEAERQPKFQGKYHGQRPLGRSRHQHDTLCLCRTRPRGRDPKKISNREKDGMDPPPRIQPHPRGG